MKKTKKHRSKEASMNGVRQTLEKYGVYPATYYSWRKIYESMGEYGLSLDGTDCSSQSVDGATTQEQPTVQRSPSVASRWGKSRSMTIFFFHPL